MKTKTLFISAHNTLTLMYYLQLQGNVCCCWTPFISLPLLSCITTETI